MSEHEKTKYTNFETGEVYHNATDAWTALRLKTETQKETEANERKIKNNQRNPPFIQLTKGISPGVMARVAKKSATAIQTLMFFFENMDSDGVIVVSQNTIAETIDVSTRTVRNSIKVLEECGALGIGKVGNANIYIINPVVAWQKGFKQRRNVILKANVILGKEEAEKLRERFGDVRDENKGDDLKIKGLSTPVRFGVDSDTGKQENITDEFEYSENNIPDDEPPLDI